MPPKKPPPPPPDAKSYPRDVTNNELGAAYDYLDKGDGERALKALDRALKKYPHWQLAQALRAIALWRSEGLNARDEVLKIARNVRDDGVVDEDVLRVVTMAFDELGATDDMVELTESVLRSNPTRLESFNSLYVLHGKAWAFAKQQSAVMRRYKVTGDSKDLMRAVAAMLAQRDEAEAAPRHRASESTSTGMAPDGLLKLAHGMMSKIHAKGELKDRDSFVMYASALAELGRCEEAYEFTLSELADSCVPMSIDRERMRAMYALKAGKHVEARKHHENVLELAPDDWASMNAILDLCRDSSELAKMCEEIGKMKVTTSGFKGDDRASYFPTIRKKGQPIDETSASAFVDGVVANADAKGGARAIGRGAYILRAELLCRLVDAERTEAREMALADEVANYHDRFSSWNSCAQDMRRYAQALAHCSSGARDKLISTLIDRSSVEVPAIAEDDEDSEKRALDVLRKKTSALLICADLNAFCPRWHGGKTSSLPTADMHVAKGFMKEYFEHRKIVSNIDAREQTPVDAYPYLASLCLVNEAALKKGSDDEAAVKALLAAAAVLEIGLQKSPHHSTLIFSLAAIYTILGAAEKALEVLGKVDMKHVQMATLLHHAMPACAAGGHTKSLQVFERLDYLRWEIDEHIAEMAVQAGMNAKFTKVLEFAEFHRTLARAHSIQSGEALVSWNLITNIMHRCVRRAEEFDAQYGGIVQALEGYAMNTGSLVDVSPDRAGWNEDDAKFDAATYVDDFKTTPPWMAPCAEDPAFTGEIWWTNSIETSHGSDEDAYSWYYRGARATRRRRSLLLNALCARHRHEDDPTVAAGEIERCKSLLNQLKSAAGDASSERDGSQAALARDVEFALVELAIHVDDASRAALRRACDKFCERSLEILRAGDITRALARGSFAVAYHARSYALATRLANVLSGVDPHAADDTTERLDAFERAIAAFIDGESLESRFTALGNDTVAWYGADDEELNDAVARVAASCSASFRVALVGTARDG